MLREEWNKFSEKDQMLLKQLGIVPEEVKEKKKKEINPVTLERRLGSMTTCPEEYYIRVFSTCGCCRTKEVREGKMTKVRSVHSYLTFVQQELTEDIEVKKQTKVTSITCPKCEEVLGQMSVTALVMRIKYLNEAQAKRGVI